MAAGARDRRPTRWPPMDRSRQRPDGHNKAPLAAQVSTRNFAPPKHEWQPSATSGRGISRRADCRPHSGPREEPTSAARMSPAARRAAWPHPEVHTTSGCVQSMSQVLSAATSCSKISPLQRAALLRRSPDRRRSQCSAAGSSGAQLEERSLSAGSGGDKI